MSRVRVVPTNDEVLFEQGDLKVRAEDEAVWLAGGDEDLLGEV